ncbi:MAG: hypothetical protein QHC40_12325 [Sphingobium sp.]|nr:hypothetical protein [Sphingobium sp.]
MPNIATEEASPLTSGEQDAAREDAAKAAAVPPVRTKRRAPWLALGLLIAFAGGVGATIAALPYVQSWWRGGDRATTAAAARRPLALAGRLPSDAQPLSVAAARLVDMRVVQLEERLNRISVEAQAASGNAARAEGLLVAFAARRALDSGTPLGYVEGQLRLRFGQAQPRAVATVINAAREPITLTDLRAGLLAVADQVTHDPPDVGWWRALEQEARELVTIRKATSPTQHPQAALDRALRYIDAGRINSALSEVERMPGRASAGRWIEYARRYQEARRALDLIETAAILEPRQLRSTEGRFVTQTSPLAP